MAQYYLLNTVRLGSQFIYPGTKIDSAYDNVTVIREAGGVLVDTNAAGMTTAADLAQTRRKYGASPAELADIMQSAFAAGGTSVVPRAKGADLTDADDLTITLAQGKRRVLPSIPITANRIYKVLTTGANRGNRWELTRLDNAAFTVKVQNAAATDLITLVASKPGFAVIEMGASDWELVAGGPT